MTAEPSSRSTAGAETAALAEVRATFPVAEVGALWTERAGDQAVTVVDVQLDHGRYLYQVVSLREGDNWYPWTSGEAPGLLEIEDPFGVVTRVDHLEPATKAVRLRHFRTERVVATTGEWLVQALWDVTESDGGWSWPEAVAVLVHDRWEPTVFVELPVRFDYLVERYVTYEESRSPVDEWASDAVMEGVCAHPHEAWRVVAAAIERAPSEQSLFTIAAGPLEDLISDHAHVVIDVIEDAARSSSKLRRALSGVWAEVSDPAIAERLEWLKG